MKRMSTIFIGVVSLLVITLFPKFEQKTNAMAQSKLKFNVSFPETVSKEAVDGRLLLLISTSNDKEPRFQISEDLSTQQVFGIDVDNWKAGQARLVDGNAFGYPRRSFAQVPPGEYWVQVLLHRYETFHRADGHTVKLPMDRGEGQQWNSAP